MSGMDRQDLEVPLNASEMELLLQAARDAGHNNVSSWARDVLLAAVGRQAGKGQEDSGATGKKKAARARPQCTCGATAGPNGQCDGSCIMRF